jgi:hypothetical protein
MEAPRHVHRGQDGPFSGKRQQGQRPDPKAARHRELDARSLGIIAGVNDDCCLR